MIMSKRSTIITVEPPVYNTDTEHIEIQNYTCPYCFGRGGWSEQIGRDKFEEHTCKVCDGAKNIKAVITIEWKPDANNKS